MGAGLMLVNLLDTKESPATPLTASTKVHTGDDRAMTDVEDQHNDRDTILMVLDVVRSEYEMENERNRLVDAKTNTLVAISGIVLAGAALLAQLGFIQNCRPLLGLLLVAAVFVLVAILSFLLTMVVRKFSRISYQAAIADAEKSALCERVGIRLMATYDQAIREHAEVVDKKIRVMQRGLLALAIGSALIVVTLVGGIAGQRTSCPVIRRSSMIHKENDQDKPKDPDKEQPTSYGTRQVQESERPESEETSDEG
jgi:hypothetical protein